VVLKVASDRQNKTLEIIISSYVDTAVPIGSRQVSKKMGLSSATVRNIMSDLEEMGYITHPHTSAGRIPTDSGYRRYIESLMSFQDINKEEARRVEDEYKFRRKGIEAIIKKTAEVLSGITLQTGVALFPKNKDSAFKRIDLISIGKKKVLVVLVSPTGVVRNFIMDTEEELAGELEAITNLLNSDFYGLSLEKIKAELLKRVRHERDSLRDVIKETSEVVESILHLQYENELYLEGASHLLSQPEFKGADAARSIMQIFEAKEVISRLMEDDLSQDGVRIYIGSEHKCRGMQNCSLVTAGYKMKDGVAGRLGIIGPTRMNYDHLIPLVNYISETLTRTLNGLFE